ncbi:MAG: MFS transporter [Gemmataceae bacterium]|nr:MFS transporter [Planctomycetia bacterium]MBX3397186.1 MFS transporter [Gemmataceae bacterium]
MLPVIGAGALSDLLGVPRNHESVRWWIGTILWSAALAGGIFGLLGGWMIDRFGRKRIMVASILMYSLSPMAAAFSTDVYQFVFFRCTTFIGVCVEMVAAVTWLAELFPDKRTRERAIAWSLAAASLGGLLVTVVDQQIVALAPSLPAIPTATGASAHAPWRYTLISGLIPGALILMLMPFVPESQVWREKKLAGTLQRPSFGELFSPGLRRTTIVTTILSACGYAAAFGALQVTPAQIILGRAEIGGPMAEARKADAAAKTDDEKAAAKKQLAAATAGYEKHKSQIQLYQEIGGLTGRILLAVLVSMVPTRLLLRLFLVPGIALFPLTYFELVTGDWMIFSIAIFFCGLLTVAQFSYLSEFLPKAFPLHLRGTGGSFATNVGGRMIGTMAATLNTAVLAVQMGGGPLGVAKAAAIIGGAVYLIAFIASFFLPEPKHDQ